MADPYRTAPITKNNVLTNVVYPRIVSQTPTWRLVKINEKAFVIERYEKVLLRDAMAADSSVTAWVRKYVIHVPTHRSSDSNEEALLGFFGALDEAVHG